MHLRIRIPLFLPLASFAMACADAPPAVAPRFRAPSFAAMGRAACPTPATVVVSDEAGLRNALNAAVPGEVIGLNGFFGIAMDEIVTTAGVTLTCVTPGSGMFAITGSSVGDLVDVLASNVVVDHLRRDGSQAADGPLFTFNDGVTAFADSIRFTNNTVACGPGSCFFLAGGVGAVVTDNEFSSTLPGGTFTGIQLQNNAPITIDGADVERNTIAPHPPRETGRAASVG